METNKKNQNEMDEMDKEVQKSLERRQLSYNLLYVRLAFYALIVLRGFFGEIFEGGLMLALGNVVLECTVLVGIELFIEKMLSYVDL